jgi:hypothetical protein
MEIGGGECVLLCIRILSFWDLFFGPLLDFYLHVDLLECLK